jgi:hypothetical protein
MTPEEERWIAIILEEGRERKLSDTTTSLPAPRRHSVRGGGRPVLSRRDGQTMGVGTEDFVQRSSKHGVSMI